MSDFEPNRIIEILFRQVRSTLKLGMQEYLAALDAVQGGFGNEDLSSLRNMLELLWCHSREQFNYFEGVWNRHVSVQTMKSVEPPPPKTEPKVDPMDEFYREEDKTRPVSVPVESVPEPEPELKFSPLPVRAPLTPLEMEENVDFDSYWPLDRRSMGYLWRYLRRPRMDGPRNVLDLQGTVTTSAKQGCFLGPVFQRREVNHARLILLIDQEGSMMPLHRFTRDIVETAQDTKSLENLRVYYFYNVPSTHMYEDAALTRPLGLDHVLNHCDSDTSVLVVSDAGAARGQRQMRRLRETSLFLAQLRRRTTLIAWLNPMPRLRWGNTTAGLLARLVPMAQMDNGGFSYLIEVLRGQSWVDFQSGDFETS